MKQTYTIHNTIIFLVQYDSFMSLDNCFILRNTECYDKDILFHRDKIYNLVNNKLVTIADDVNYSTQLAHCAQQEIAPPLIVDSRRLYRIPNSDRYMHKAVLAYEATVAHHEYVVITENIYKQRCACKITENMKVDFFKYRLWDYTS